MAGGKKETATEKPKSVRYNAKIKPQNMRKLRLMAILQDKRPSAVLNELCRDMGKRIKAPAAEDLTKVEAKVGRPLNADRANLPRMGATERFGAHFEADVLLKVKLAALKRGVIPSTIMDELIELAPLPEGIVP